MRYQHDCYVCTPLGEYGDADLYFCNKGGIETVIARHSNQGSDYTSGLYMATALPDLREAKKRAIKAGFLTDADSLTRAPSSR